MTGLRQLWSSVFVKFSGAFIVVGMIPLFALSLFSLQTFTGHVQKYTVNNLTQMTLYMSYNLNNAFNHYNEITKLMYNSKNNGTTESTLVSQSFYVDQLEQINQIPIEDFLKTVLYSDPYIRTAFFVRQSDKKLYYQTREGNALLTDRLPIDTWLLPLQENPTRLAVHLTHSMKYVFNSQRNVITFGRSLIDISGPVTPDRKVVGALFIDVDSRIFYDMFRELNLGDNDELYVLDGNDFVYHSNKEEIIGARRPVSGLTDSDKFVISERLSFLNGRVVLRISKNDLFEQLTSTQSAVYVAIAICVFVLIVMGGWFSKRLAEPIRVIIKQMAKVESGNLETQVAKYGNDEIGRLAHGFNRMVERLNNFIHEAYIAELGRKQAELNALKSQIRPHYLYNTLEVIRMNAVHNDDSEVADMILSLSNQLKYVIDYGEDWVSIRRELDHLHDYFYIIGVRFENRIELRVDVASGVDPEWQILKLSLQPIVENAIQHGIRPKGGKGKVWLTIETIDEDLTVTVYDDGVGIDEESLADLNARIDDPKTAVKGVGMKNVHERIKSVCGDNYGLEISSKKHIGTSVRMRFPIRKEAARHGDTSHTGG
ncbi:cache domain-containing sensor histidine kinase [Paenibacillus alkalitolerans]|uniref:cache domain-containing sensor histidine kinase n=1 Tax=Paenibacillus alkalitolerans TaxID=2799335 RepID=UPI0018F7C25F|nr:sensor histidine kinase [Paenibacillus alkalitolerans]